MEDVTPPPLTCPVSFHKQQPRLPKQAGELTRSTNPTEGAPGTSSSALTATGAPKFPSQTLRAHQQPQSPQCQHQVSSVDAMHLCQVSSCPALLKALNLSLNIPLQSWRRRSESLGSCGVTVTQGELGEKPRNEASAGAGSALRWRELLTKGNFI